MPADLPVPGGAMMDARRWALTDVGTASVLALVAAGMVAGIAYRPEDVPINLIFLPLVLGILFLSNRVLPWFAGYVLIALGCAALLQEEFTARIVAALGVMAGVSVLVILMSLRRGQIGNVGPLRGQSMLVDLRDRILAQGEIPALPPTWLVESALSSAGGSPFAGDFVVATTGERNHRIELVVVDVSGKGEAAGTRALQLSGAMGGLVTALPPDRFLPAANDYLLKRAWEEGFATAVHVSVDLVTGAYELRSAGHPPALQRHAGSGRWQLLPAEGPILGIVEDVEYACYRGRLDPGDSLLLYTDGMVEEPRRDIDLGIDHMMGAAESLLRHSWDGLADRLVAAVGSPDDDRALLVVHRRP
ncbi:PP2C family protein-serine/threonine phosphatase [Pimelobacter simplex]|uniref:Serine/threonine-protein phosphatase n=1 Tax=Nocardioides simplex TaxID=2045 RepID=A0A7J5E0V5_NOCSI|nr:PP2C family protein-serine/threonine phosphatase [Pimelobacter simplex]KAB2811818.1 serine/threonine-protein phosphatase [Pimelobacter simplex]